MSRVGDEKIPSAIALRAGNAKPQAPFKAHFGVPLPSLKIRLVSVAIAFRTGYFMATTEDGIFPFDDDVIVNAQDECPL